MTRTTRSVFAAAITVGAAAGLAPAQVTLSGDTTADNLFFASISTSPTAAGTAWFSGNNWQQMWSSGTEITDPGTYYLHVRTVDQGSPEMFIGRFTLTGADALFANGTTVLTTNVADWVVSNTGFGVNAVAPEFIGDNGAGPWGTQPLVQNAQFIWAPEYGEGTAYFTASFTIVPAPGAAALGCLGLLAIRRRR